MRNRNVWSLDALLQAQRKRRSKKTHNGTFFLCRLYAGGRQKRWPPQTGGGQPSADGSGLPRPSAKRFLLPAVEEFRPDGTRFVRPHKRGFPFAADRRLGARAGASPRRRGPFPFAKVAAGFVGGMRTVLKNRRICAKMESKTSVFA